MATLEQNIVESIKANQEAYLKEYMRQVRVTLLSEYEHNDGIVTMRYASEAARVEGEPNEDDDLIDLSQKRPVRITAGRPVHYHMSFEPRTMTCLCQDDPFEINDTIVMPLPGAMIWFGHWLNFGKKPKAGGTPDTAASMAWQKKLVALQWGGYQVRPFDARYDAPKSWRKLENIGIPPVPNVEIVRLDSQLRKLPNSEFRPWEVYDFHKDVVPDRWSEQPGERVMSFTEADLKAFIAEQVAAATSGVAVKNKGGRPRKVI